MGRKRNNPEAVSREVCRFFKQGKCTKGVSRLKSHDAQDTQSETGTEVAFDRGIDVNTVSESTASEVKKQNRGKTGANRAGSLSNGSAHRAEVA